MTHELIGVGIIGVNPGRGWATTAHIPALRALPNYAIRALSATTRASAAAAGAAFDVALTFSDHHELVARPEVDLVVVTVKAPHHRELVTAALNAGKAVYCEWPLGVDLEDAVAMADLAAEKKVPTRSPSWEPWRRAPPPTFISAKDSLAAPVSSGRSTEPTVPSRSPPRAGFPGSIR